MDIDGGLYAPGRYYFPLTSRWRDRMLCSLGFQSVAWELDYPAR